MDRPQLVLLTGANRVMLAEQSRWAEPLKDSIARVIAGDLAQLLHDARVSAYPERVTNDADYRVLVDVQRFESTQGDAAIIDILWTIRDAKAGNLKAGRSTIREPAGGGDHDALAAVSRDIAAALREVIGMERSSK